MNSCPLRAEGWKITRTLSRVGAAAAPRPPSTRMMMTNNPIIAGCPLLTACPSLFPEPVVECRTCRPRRTRDPAPASRSAASPPLLGMSGLLTPPQGLLDLVADEEPDLLLHCAELRRVAQAVLPRPGKRHRHL